MSIGIDPDPGLQQTTGHPTKPFGEKLQDLADRARLTQDQLARKIAAAMDRAGYRGPSRPPSKSTVARFLAGRSLPDLDQAWFLARLFGVPVDYLADIDQTAPSMEGFLTAQEQEIVELARWIGPEQSRRRLLLLPDRT